MDPPVTQAPPARTSEYADGDCGAGAVVQHRLLVEVPMLIATSIGMFLLGAASPIDPAKQYAGAAAFTATEENLAQIRAKSVCRPAGSADPSRRSRGSSC